MKNKVFVPVPVSERLPKKTIPVIGIYANSYALLYVDANGWWWKIWEHSSYPTPLYWLEEREDRTAEMVDVLKGLVSDVDNLLGDYDIEWQQAGYLAEAKLLITSIEKGENNG